MTRANRFHQAHAGADDAARSTRTSEALHDPDRETDDARFAQYVAGLCQAKGLGCADVLVLGCGEGGRAVVLARGGHRVTVIDRPSALARVREEAAAASVEVAGLDRDSLAPDGVWPIAAVDVVVSTDPAACGQPNAYARVLRAARRALNAGGLLVVRLNAPNDSAMYTSSTVAPLVRSAGFEIEHVVDNAGTSIAPRAWPPATSIIATPAPTLPDTLALGSHQSVAPETALNLRWSPDEAEFLTPTPEQIWAPLLVDARHVMSCARDYMLSDPWGSERIAPVLTSHFGVRIAPSQVVVAAGATSLLRQVASLARDGCVLTHPLVHRDLPLWAAAEGARLAWIDDTLSPAETRHAIATERPDLIHIDRPTARGEVVPLALVADLCREAMARQALVSIDESYLAYRPAAASAAPLTAMFDNLVVIRGLSKAYCCGGLRVGFALTGMAVADLRRLMPPLQTSTLALEMALRLLAAGDIFGALRQRIGEAKAEMTARLADDGHRVLAGEVDLPWVLIEDPDGQVRRDLEGRGILGKQLVPFSRRAGPKQEWLRLAAPLSDERITIFRRLIDA
jgi:histidinol-phosphate/aromatic aminotransferase/cobyric acid decarboxylase-like protein/SAM-dependent methyltransferase